MTRPTEKIYNDEEIFSILHPLVKQWFKQKFGSFCLTQQYGVMPIHSRENILVSAPTGFGKTLTAFLSILNELIDLSEKNLLEDRIYCVYVSPLRALNRDIARNLIQPLKEIEEIADKKLNIKVSVRTGDTTAKEKQQMLKKSPHILITTPESLAILLSSKKFVEHLREVQWCITDEIHALADNKRGVHLSLSVERLARLSSHMARVGLSATISPLDEIAKFLVGSDGDCKIVDISFEKNMDLKVLSPVKNLIDSSHEKMHTEMYQLINSLVQEHRTTLIFTNTRAATERVVDHLKHKFPGKYTVENIGAHHGSLSRDIRFNIENRLKEGKLKAVVCSTSLELGVDIGYIDLVICLGSPKSVARFLQRAGRAGHQLHEKVKARIIVLNRDDLIECSVLLKLAIEKKIDKIHISHNCLDVLAQHIHGIAISEKIHFDDLFKLVKQSYCYHSLTKKDFLEVVNYLAGKFVSLEERYIYAKIWYDEKTGMIGRKGKMSRVIYMTNIGTIPDQTRVRVQVGNQVIGTIDEPFLERLKKGDVFVLGGSTYVFRYAKGMIAYVNASANRPPTIPRWVSESLPLSFDLAVEIGKFRGLMSQYFCLGKSKEKIIDFINSYLYVDTNSAESIYQYFNDQFQYTVIPSNTLLVIENYNDEKEHHLIFHSLYGRRVNDCLSRAIAYIISRTHHFDVEIGINDNGFFIKTPKNIKIDKALKVLKTSKLKNVLKLAIEFTEVLRRRFRHCATRSFMILRNYKGRKKYVGRQQVSSMILMNAVKRISFDFAILKEARREVLEDLMDIKNAKLIVDRIKDKKIIIKKINTSVPSPFAFNLVVQGYSDIMKIEDKVEFLKKMHKYVQVKIGLKK